MLVYSTRIFSPLWRRSLLSSFVYFRSCLVVFFQVKKSGYQRRNEGDLEEKTQAHGNIRKKLCTDYDGGTLRGQHASQLLTKLPNSCLPIDKQDRQRILGLTIQGTCVSTTIVFSQSAGKHRFPNSG